MAKAKRNLGSMSFEALIALRENVGQVLRQRSEELRRQLQRLEPGGRSSTGAMVARRGARKGQKVPPKYRDPENPSNVWAGRGAIPRWMAEKIKAGAKREDFLIGARGAATRKKRPGKKVRKVTRKKAQRRSVPSRKKASGRKKRQQSGAAAINNIAATEPRTE